jgi:Ca2+-binding EF-hand superfamily protein
MQNRATLRELDDIVRTPDRLPRYVDDRKVETVFRLWDLDQNGKVKRETIVRSLMK